MDVPDATLRAMTGYRIQRAAIRALARVNAALAPLGLRRSTFSALAVVADCPGLRQAQLARALAIERPNLVQIVDELERAGLMVREPAEGDRRAHALRATAAGRDLYARALVRLRVVETALTRGLAPAEMAMLHRALQVVEDNASADGGEETQDGGKLSGA
ncbi:hypothetical protein U879_09090 [Defluviimonas sp. 20V17]|uniref:DNA-binding transcriptional regulator, MarR family n=1 Tax=Allgaiera indica TaxID=765699 RepID=A0AAN4UP35_9RHOB|nr:MarR family transcriptional regulator [Allgaiera indica]KDB03993.1 hypothetical protein U879_09090 [Defluviimonas sp. 20V17]GHD99372.1 MarR family transcriptional regulator [Allgaiera indica]SDW27873.1 DNA-binding transcriptional regulator, MarR family [Allgaiera indica]